MQSFVTDLHGTRVYEHKVFHHVHDGCLYVVVGYKSLWLEVTPEDPRRVYGLPVLVHAAWEAARVTAELYLPRS